MKLAKRISLILLALGLLATGSSLAQEETLQAADADEAPVTQEQTLQPTTVEEAPVTTELQQDIRDLKNQVLQLNRNLFILEEDLLFPANTQFSVFLSMDAGQLFTLDSVELKVDDKVVSNHLYTERELDALKRGGTQRLYLGNLASGEHEIIAIFTGKGPSNRDYRRGETLTVEKGSEPQFVELQIIDNPGKEQPEFRSRVWE